MMGEIPYDIALQLHMSGFGFPEFSKKCIFKFILNSRTSFDTCTPDSWGIDQWSVGFQNPKWCNNELEWKNMQKSAKKCKKSANKSSEKKWDNIKINDFYNGFSRITCRNHSTVKRRQMMQLMQFHSSHCEQIDCKQNNSHVFAFTICMHTATNCFIITYWIHNTIILFTSWAYVFSDCFSMYFALVCILLYVSFCWTNQMQREQTQVHTITLHAHDNILLAMMMWHHFTKPRYSDPTPPGLWWFTSFSGRSTFFTFSIVFSHLLSHVEFFCTLEHFWAILSKIGRDPPKLLWVLWILLSNFEQNWGRYAGSQQYSLLF